MGVCVSVTGLLGVVWVSVCLCLGYSGWCGCLCFCDGVTQGGVGVCVSVSGLLRVVCVFVAGLLRVVWVSVFVAGLLGVVWVSVAGDWVTQGGVGVCGW